MRAEVLGTDPTIAAEITSLRHDADKMRAAGPFSVLDKKLVPPQRRQTRLLFDWPVLLAQSCRQGWSAVDYN